MTDATSNAHATQAPHQRRTFVSRYAVAVIAVSAAVLLKLAGSPWLVQENPFLLFFAAVMVSAWYGGGGPGLLSTVAAALVSDYLFMEPRWSFGDFSRYQAAHLLGFVFEGSIISLLGGMLHRARYAAEVAADGERRSTTEAKLARAELAVAFEKQRRIAETLQRSLLPTIHPGSFPGLDVAALYEAALDEARIGGDFYDAFSLSDGRVALVVGDVSGKGLAAAERTAEAKYAIRSLMHQNPVPCEALTSLNRHLCLLRHAAAGDGEAAAFRFITVALALVNPENGEVVLALAGAEPPLVVQSATATVSEVSGESNGHGLPLGVEEQAEYCSLRLELTDGDFLLLFTDGLTEARKPGARREFLDAAGFQEFVHQEYQRHNPQAGGTSAKEIGHALLERVQSYSGGTLQDDACLLLMRLTSATLKDKGQGDGS